LKQQKSFNATINLKGDVAADVKSVVAFIEKSENEVKTALDKLFDAMADVVRPMRRTLPFTQTKMDWNIQAHKVAHAITKK